MESRRLFLAILLSLAVLVGWQYLVGPPEPPSTAGSEEAESTGGASGEQLPVEESAAAEEVDRKSVV